MPIDFVLVRHGESEGNIAQELSKTGDDSLWTPDFKHRHTSKYRLTDKGRDQARSAGKWLKEHMGRFDKHFCSEYVRAMETASYMNLDAKWTCDFFLRERDQGVLQNLSKVEREIQYAAELKRQDTDMFYYAPPGGESIANSCMRVHRVLSKLMRSCSGFKILAVSHGNMIWAFRICIEQMTQTEFQRRLKEEKIYNGQILHFTRRNPETGEIAPEMGWMRSVCPWKPTNGEPVWVEIQRPLFDDALLLQAVEKYPQLINNSEAKKRKKKKKKSQGAAEEPKEVPSAVPDLVQAAGSSDESAVLRERWDDHIYRFLRVLQEQGAGPTDIVYAREKLNDGLTQLISGSLGGRPV